MTGFAVKSSILFELDCQIINEFGYWILVNNTRVGKAFLNPEGSWTYDIHRGSSLSIIGIPPAVSCSYDSPIEAIYAAWAYLANSLSRKG